MPYHSLELVDLVQHLALHQAAMARELALFRELAERRGAARLPADSLLVAIYAALGDHVFVSAEIHARALRSDAPALLLQAHIGTRSVKSLGKLLASVADTVTPEGLILRCVDDSHRPGCIWQVSKAQTSRA